MEADFTDGNQRFFFSSSENMSEIPANIIDVIITSPPYNVGKHYSANGHHYNDNKDLSAYLDFLETVFHECYRVASDRCLFFLNIGDSAQSQGKSEKVVQRAVTAGFTRLQTIIWIKSLFGKGHYTPSGRNRRLNNLWENVFVLYKNKKYQIEPKQIGIPYSDKSNIGRYADVDKRDAGDLWFIPYTKTTGKTIKKGHEAPFPIELPYRCLQLVKNPHNVLDPFVGTGSTLRAAKELEIPGYGYEILPRQDVIQTRMQEPISPLSPPLIPQLEYYSTFLTHILNKLSAILPDSQIQSVLNEENIVPRREFAWAADDLNLNPLLLDHIKNDERIFPKKKFYLKSNQKN